MKQMSFAVLVAILTFAATTAECDQEELTGQELAYLLTLKEYDLTCHRLDSEGRERFDAFMNFRVENSTLTAPIKSQVLRRLEGASASSDFDCNGDNSLFDKGLAIFANSDEPSAPSEKSLEATPSPAKAEAALQGARRAIASLEPGGLTQYVGCHTGTSDGIGVKLCFSDGGESVALTLTNASAGVSCSLTDGEARRREQGAYMYAAQPQRQCSDGSRVTHAEGLCEPKGGGFSCLLSVFKYANEFYLFKGSDEGVNLQLVLQRAG